MFDGEVIHKILFPVITIKYSLHMPNVFNSDYNPAIIKVESNKMNTENHISFLDLEI